MNYGMKDYERLKQAREGAQYNTAADAARAFGWNEVTYRAHDSGQNGFKLALARRYARAFSVNVEWLVSGMGATKKNGPIDPDFEEFKSCYYSIDPASRKILLDLARRFSVGSDQGV